MRLMIDLTLKKVHPHKNWQDPMISLPPNPLIILISQNNSLITNQCQRTISMLSLRIRNRRRYLGVLNIIFIVHVFSNEESDAFIIILGRWFGHRIKCARINGLLANTGSQRWTSVPRCVTGG
jgi:hypothetical protein